MDFWVCIKRILRLESVLSLTRHPELHSSSRTTTGAQVSRFMIRLNGIRRRQCDTHHIVTKKGAFSHNARQCSCSPYTYPCEYSRYLLLGRIDCAVSDANEWTRGKAMHMRVCHTYIWDSLATTQINRDSGKAATDCRRSSARRLDDHSLRSLKRTVCGECSHSLTPLYEFVLPQIVSHKMYEYVIPQCWNAKMRFAFICELSVNSFIHKESAIRCVYISPKRLLA